MTSQYSTLRACLESRCGVAKIEGFENRSAAYVKVCEQRIAENFYLQQARVEILNRLLNTDKQYQILESILQQSHSRNPPEKSRTFSIRFYFTELAALKKLAGSQPVGTYVRKCALREWAEPRKRKYKRKPNRVERLPDPRIFGLVDHPLSALLRLFILGKLCGRETMKSAYRMGKNLSANDLKKLGFTNGKSPAYTTITETIKRIDYEQM